MKRGNDRAYQVEANFDGHWGYFSEPLGENLKLSPTSYLEKCQALNPTLKLRLRFFNFS